MGGSLLETTEDGCAAEGEMLQSLYRRAIEAVNCPHQEWETVDERVVKWDTEQTQHLLERLQPDDEE